MTDETYASGNGQQPLRARADKAVEKGFERAHEGLDKAQSSMETAVQRTDESVAMMRAYITEQARVRPLTTAAAVAGVGLVFGLLLARR